MLKQRLLTDMEQVRCGIGSDSSCVVCSFELEDILHAIRDCIAAKEILAQVILSDKQRWFCSGNIHEWLVDNLQSKQSLALGGRIGDPFLVFLHGVFGKIETFSYSNV